MVKKNQKLQKLNEWIDTWYNNGNVEGIEKPPMLVLCELEAIVNDECKKTTTNEKTLNILRKLDIKVKQEKDKWRFRK